MFRRTAMIPCRVYSAGSEQILGYLGAALCGHKTRRVNDCSIKISNSHFNLQNCHAQQAGQHGQAKMPVHFVVSASRAPV